MEIFSMQSIAISMLGHVRIGVHTGLVSCHKEFFMLEALQILASIAAVCFALGLYFLIKELREGR
jgi:hypothetical protein